MDPIEITFKDGFRLWYVCDCTGPAIIVSEPNRVPTRDQEHKIWIVDGIYRSAYVESKFLSKLFGLCAPMIRKELKHYPTLKWEDAPIEIEINCSNSVIFVFAKSLNKNNSSLVLLLFILFHYFLHYLSIKSS